MLWAVPSGGCPHFFAKVFPQLQAASVVSNNVVWQRLRARADAERRLWEAVLIHKHRARLSPRLIPGPSQFVALFFFGTNAA
jgi:hypothetical protein